MKLFKLATLLVLLPSVALAGGPPAPGTTPSTVKVCVRSTSCGPGPGGCSVRCFKVPPPNCSGDGPNCVPAPPNCSGCALVPEDDPWLDGLIEAGCEPLSESAGEVLVDCGGARGIEVVDLGDPAEVLEDL